MVDLYTSHGIDKQWEEWEASLFGKKEKEEETEKEKEKDSTSLKERKRGRPRKNSKKDE